MISDTELNQISTLAKRQHELELLLTKAEQHVELLKAQLREVREILLPAAMSEVHMSEFTLDSGEEIKVKSVYFASIPENKTEEAFRWLRDHNFGSIIKNQISLRLGKGQDQDATVVKDFLTRAGLDFDQKVSVHPKTLQSFVRDMIETGREFPMELFGAGEAKQTIVKLSAE